MNQSLENAFLTRNGAEQAEIAAGCSVYAENDDDKKDLFQESLIQIWQSLPFI